MTRETSRRQLLGLTAGLALANAAGCMGAPGDGAGNETGTGDDHDHENGSESDDHGSESDDHGSESDDHGSESDDHDHGGDLGEPVAAATLTMQTTDGGEHHFEPHVVRVETGGTVTFELGSGAHSATAYAPANDRPRRIPTDAEAWDTGTLTEADATVERTFETPGVYDVFCRPHESSGMIASVVVGDPSPEGQPGLAAPQSSLPEDARSKLGDLNERVRSALS